MEESSESGMDAESSSECEDLRNDINVLAQLDESSDVAYKIILESNNMIVNKAPSSSSLKQSSANVNNLTEASINIDNLNPANLNMDRLELPNTDTEKKSTETNVFNQRHLEPEALDLSTNSSNKSMASPNKSIYLLTSNYLQHFNRSSNELSTIDINSTNSIDKMNQSEENSSIDRLDTYAHSIDQNQPGSSLEFIRKAIEKSNNIKEQTITDLDVSVKSLENSSRVHYVEESLHEQTKPTNQSENESDPKTKLQLFGEDTGPHWHKVVNNLVTPPVITGNLPKIFADFPIFGRPENRADRESFQDRMVRKFVGCDLDDGEYAELKEYCSVDNLKTGKELNLPSKIPTVGPISGPLTEAEEKANEKEEVEDPDLFVLRKLKTRMEQDHNNAFTKKLKYRGCRILPMSFEEERNNIPSDKPPDLEPGKDILYKVRVYRPFVFTTPKIRASMRGRHSVFSCDMYVAGRQALWALRDRLVCRNDAELRLDVSAAPIVRPHATSKDMFPSGFLFINNVFYVDRRAGCRDTSAVVRQWARGRGIGDFPVRDMALSLQDIAVKLAHPEVYVHQGNCEHVFLFSEIRLLSYNDPLHLSCYPCHTSVSQNQTIYCTTCADFGAKWIVTGCDRVPFDPAFFCDICFKHYLYKDGKKIGNFKAYAYKGNELSILKHQASENRDGNN